MERYFEANRRRWNELVDIHTKSGGYDVNGFLKGKSSLHSIELEALPDVEGKTLLHLQCHFGMDTLSWARRGAVVTGIDFSDKGVEMARLLAEKTGLTARWINCNLYNLPPHLDEKFDIVYTSYGVLMWLNDVEEWALGCLDIGLKWSLNPFTDLGTNLSLTVTPHPLTETTLLKPTNL